MSATQIGRWFIDHQATLNAALDDWEAQAVIARRPKTVVYNRALVKRMKKHWDWELGTPCDQIRPASIGRFVEIISPSSDNQFNHMVNVLRVLVPAARFVRRRKVRPKIVHLPSHDLFQVLLRELDQSRNPRAGLIVRFLALTGLRITEAATLPKSNVLPDGIQVDGHHTKNGRSRMIPWIGDCAVVTMKLMWSRPGSDLVLGGILQIRKAIKLACRRAGIPHLSHHDFRRLFATRVVQSAVDMPTAARWMGHSDGGALLAKTYYQHDWQHQCDLAERVKI